MLFCELKGGRRGLTYGRKFIHRAPSVLMRILTVLLVLLFPVALTKAATDVMWVKTYGGPEEDMGLCGAQTIDGGYILVGRTESYDVGAGDIWLIKTDPAGQVLWNRTYGGPEEDWGWGGAQTADGGYILTGWTMSHGAGSWDAFLALLGPISKRYRYDSQNSSRIETQRNSHNE